MPHVRGTSMTLRADSSESEGRRCEERRHAVGMRDSRSACLRARIDSHVEEDIVPSLGDMINWRNSEVGM